MLVVTLSRFLREYSVLAEIEVPLRAHMEFELFILKSCEVMWDFYNGYMRDIWGLGFFLLS